MTKPGGDDLLMLLERIAVALEDRNALARRETMKAEPGERPRKYIEPVVELPNDEQAEPVPAIRRPRQSSRS